MPQYSLLGLTPSGAGNKNSSKAKRPRPISKRAFLFGLGTSLYAIAGLMDLVSYWSNVNDEEDDELNDSLTENATPIAALAAFLYILMSILTLSVTPSALTTSRQHHHHHNKRKHPWWQKLLEDHLEVRAEYTLQVLFLIGSILLFGAEELKTHKLMRSLRKQQRASQYCFVGSLHLFWLSTYGLYKIIPNSDSESHDKKKTAEDEPELEQQQQQQQQQEEESTTTTPANTEGSLEKCGRLLLIMGTTIELSLIYVEYFSQAKISTSTILMGTFCSALFWWTNALLVCMKERYYYPDHLLIGLDKNDGNIVDFSFEDAMNLPDRLRQRLQAHRRHVTHIRVV
ncbi:unnamed protein product [Cylindrotheca closterium]|uniref:Uncharacterized protein n=1 Tax=Cylindrotheca closterium TaxID=2856 RepID=A0AAD2JIE8_9STRA|nr:unnamed protein product [Cylindrotheca closterium]